AEFHAVRIDDGALDAAVRLSRRLAGRWPDSALDLLDDACAAARLSASGDAADASVDARRIAEAAADRGRRTRALRPPRWFRRAAEPAQPRRPLRWFPLPPR